MTRIVCRTPSTGKGIRIAESNVSANDFVVIAEAPDFSVPDASNKFPERDPENPGRAIRPGEIFFLTPLAARNKDEEDRWIEVILVTENSETIEVGKIEVPAGDTAFIPLQGRSLFKRVANNEIGDTIQVKAEEPDIFDVWAAAEERLSSEHSGVE
jgi:hypothetical protein